jgi:hypothetical protein
MPVTLVRPQMLYAWRGPSLVIVDTRGECGDRDALTGYYFREARFLRTLQLRIDGEQPWLCEAASVAPALLSFVYTYPEVAEYGGGGTGQSGDEVPENANGIPQRALSIAVTIAVHVHGLEITSSIANHANRTVDFELAWMVGADFADIQEAQSSKRQQQADVEQRSTHDGVSFVYRHEKLRYSAAIRVDGDGDWSADGPSLRSRLTLERGQSATHSLTVEPTDAHGAPLQRARQSRGRIDRRRQRSRPGVIPTPRGSA